MSRDPGGLPDKAQARRSFGLAADSYDEAAVLQREVGSRLLERLDVMKIQPQDILDLGSGTGQCIDGLNNRYRKARVVALDIAPPMLKRARQRGRWLRRPQCVCADAERLPFGDNSFDMVFSNLMLQWCIDLDAVFSELRRVLRPGGLLLFSSFGPDTLRELRESWREVDRYAHVNTFLDMHDVGDALVRTRFADPVMDVERLTMTYPDVWKLMRELKQVGAHNVTGGRPRGLTGKHHLQQLIEAYEKFRCDGVLPASYEVVNGHAWVSGNEISVSLETGNLP
ncbi:malonyl-CoA O-methyltransferase [Thiogranum longum]|uniref:Malonyl-[acyl-carrier protein] O-methyltransferase n=1 Tax=Thiogranum longum TaxID=1537524 RepID=A0A4R1H984_9GAMM|nr:malonyl-ACP O-methyltransferase BioC [Thiogranum longum]TCK17071.1 malonyl-CoA O-methyltransferase [Thiogranum longum]